MNFLHKGGRSGIGIDALYELAASLSFLRKTCGVHVYISGMQDEFSQDAELENVLFPHTWHLSPFCLYVKEDRERWDVCIRNKLWLYGALRHAGGAPVCGHCPFGVHEVSWPITVQGRLVGAVSAGMYQGDEAAVADRFAHAQRRYGADAARLAAHYAECALARGPLQCEAESQMPLLAGALSTWALEGRLAFSPEARKTHELVARALTYIRTHAGEDLSVPQIAEHVCISESYLQHLFQRVRGRSVVRTIVDVRLEWARQLLTDGRLSVAETALTCGFADPNYFSTVFARRFGMPPSAYRRQAK